MNRTSATVEAASRMASGFFLLILRVIYILVKPYEKFQKFIISQSMMISDEAG